MTVENETAGTPSPEGGDAGANTQTTGTPESEGRDARDITANPEQIAAWKEAAEERNRLAARVEELERRGEHPPGATTPQSPPQADEDWATLREAAAQGDVYARTQLRLAQALLIKEQQDRDRDAIDAQLDEIPDAGERREVRKHLMENRNRLGDAKAARAELNEKRLAQENAALKKRLASFETQNPGAETVRLPPREVPNSETKTRNYTREQFEAEAKRVRDEQGDLGERLWRQKNLDSLK